MRFHDMEEIKAVGKWWVPGRKQPPFPGTLHFFPEECPSLELFDNMQFLTQSHDGKYTDRGLTGFLPLVCGRTEFGPATLLHMRHRKADFLISDALFESKKEARFRRVRLQFQHLLQWIGQPVIQDTMAFWERGGDEAVCHYRSLLAEKFSGNGLECKILFGLKTRDDLIISLKLYPMIYFEITSSTLRSVHNWWYNVIRPLRDLFSLAMDRPIAVTRFEVIDEREPERMAAKRVFFKEREINGKERRLTKKDMLFGRNDISFNIGDLVNKWLKMSTSSDISVLCNLYSSAIRRTREQYVDEDFLTLTRAVEIYHRARFNNFILPQEEWKNKMRNIFNKVPNKVEQQWLKEKLCRSNVPTLQNRLEEILSELEPATSLLVADRKGFAELVRNTRNHFVHWDHEREGKAVSYPDLYFVSGTLRYLITACLLRELGFNANQTAQFFKKNIRINKFRRNSDNKVACGMC